MHTDPVIHAGSGFQTGCLMLPHKVSLSLCLASVATKTLTKERLKYSVLPVLFTGVFVITLHTLCRMHFAARHVFVLSIFQLFPQASNWLGCQCWYLFSEVLSASAMLFGLGFHPDQKLEIYYLELVFKCQTDTSFLLLTKSWGQTNIPDAAVGVNGFINSRSRVPWTLLLAASKEGKLTFKYFVFKDVVVFFMMFTLANWNLWDRLFFFVDYLVPRNQIDSKASVGCWNWSCQAPLQMQENKNVWVGLLWVQAYEFHLLGMISLPQSNQEGYYYADTKIFFFSILLSVACK